MNSSLALQERVHFGELLVQMEQRMGTRDTCMAFLECLREAVEHTRFTDRSDAVAQVMGFYDMFAHVRPRMAIIQFYLDRIAERIACSREPLEKLASVVEHEIAEAQKDSKDRSTRLNKIAVRVIQNGNRILIHSHSHTVLDVLMAAKKAGKHFEVIVAEQEAGRTLDMVKFLASNDMPFVVVPEYMLSHIESDVSCMLVGAVTLKHDMHFAVDAGTKAIVSEMRSANVPVYLMLTTNKFSYWKTRQAHQVIRTVKNVQRKDGLTYERIKFSHDRLSIIQVDKVITEEGVYDVPHLREMYATKLSEYHEHMLRLQSCGISGAHR